MMPIISAETVCCQSASKATHGDPALKRMMVFDWYDGPASGVLMCEACEAWYSFKLADWSDDHRIRVFGLQRMHSSVLAEISQLLQETPSWPIWVPAKVKTPTEADRSVLDKIGELLSTPAAPSLVVGWSVPLERAICMRSVPPALVHNVADLLAQDDARSGYDWLTFLGLSRRPSSAGLPSQQSA